MSRETLPTMGTSCLQGELKVRQSYLIIISISNYSQRFRFHRRNQNSAQTLTMNNANSIRNSNYDGNRPTIVIAHGWLSNRNTEPNPTIRNGMLGLTVAVIDAYASFCAWRLLAVYMQKPLLLSTKALWRYHRRVFISIRCRSIGHTVLYESSKQVYTNLVTMNAL